MMMTPAVTLTLVSLILFGGSLLVSCHDHGHDLKCYLCDSKVDKTCLNGPSDDVTCEAEKFCTTVFYKIPSIGERAVRFCDQKASIDDLDDTVKEHIEKAINELDKLDKDCASLPEVPLVTMSVCRCDDADFCNSSDSAHITSYTPVMLFIAVVTSSLIYC